MPRKRTRPLIVGAALTTLFVSTLGLAPGTAGARSTTIVKTFHAAQGGGTTATISEHANVVDYLSPDSAVAGRYEHMGVGAIGEGYVLCYTGAAGTVNAFDLGASESGFGPSSILSQSASNIVIDRSTDDNRISLTQTVSFNGPNRAVLIHMKVRNKTGSPIKNVVLRRQVDFDVDTGGLDGWAGFQNWHGTTTATTAFSWNDPSSAPADKDAHAMQLKFIQATRFVTHRAYTTNDILDSSCAADSRRTSGPSFGDFGGTLAFNVGTLPAGGSKFALVEYSRF